MIVLLPLVWSCDGTKLTQIWLLIRKQMGSNLYRGPESICCLVLEAIEVLGLSFLNSDRCEDIELSGI